MTTAVRGADEVAKLLTRPLAAAIEAGQTAILAEAQTVMAASPVASHAKQAPRSAKQRRAVFALIRAGLIPYRRSGDLGRAWQIVKAGPLRVALVNRQKYAGLVQGLDQAEYHKGTWKTVQDGRDAVQPRAGAIMAQAIAAVWQ